MSTFRLTISSVDKTHFDGEVESVTLPGTAGDMTLLAHHEPIITTLREGVIIIRPSKSETDAKKLTIKTGILECSSNRAVVLL